MDEKYEDFRRVSKVQYMPLADQTLMWPSSKDKRKGKAEYVWIDDSKTIKSKTIMISRCLDKISELPTAEHLSKYILRPVAIFDDILVNETDMLVLCEMEYLHSKRRHCKEKKRDAYRKIMLSEHLVKAGLLFEIEQEFVFKQCVDMSNFSMGKARKVTDAFCKACYNALIPIHSVTYKSSHNECWSYKIGPCLGQQAGDILWMSRYIIKRIAEQFDLTVTFEPLNSIKSGDHLSEEFQPRTKYRFSTEKMRGTDIATAIFQYDAALAKIIKHSEHEADIEVIYGKACEHWISYIKIPPSVEQDRHIEDGRPAGYSDPYDVISYLMKTCLL